MIFLNEGLEDHLDKLIEECSEVIQAATKIKRFGVNNWHPDTEVKNGVQLLEELIDLRDAMENVRKFLPKPDIKDMADEVIEWFRNSTLRQQQEFLTTDFENLVVFHHNLGEMIRNHFNLWHYEWEAKIVNGVDMSPEHPDTISMKVIEEVWRRVKDD
jgi:hypothetical protein